MQLNPNSSPVHQDYALFLSLTNRDEEAITEISRAVELDPLSGMALGVGVGVRVFAREFKEAVTLARRIVGSNSNDADAHTILSFAYLAEGSVDQAYEELQQVRKEISKRSSEIKLGWARGLNPWIYAISCYVLVYEKEEQILRKIIAEAEEYRERIVCFACRPCGSCTSHLERLREHSVYSMQKFKITVQDLYSFTGAKYSTRYEVILASQNC